MWPVWVADNNLFCHLNIGSSAFFSEMAWKLYFRDNHARIKKYLSGLPKGRSKAFEYYPV
jgi:hypothetical protein